MRQMPNVAIHPKMRGAISVGFALLAITVAVGTSAFAGAKHNSHKRTHPSSRLTAVEVVIRRHRRDLTAEQAHRLAVLVSENARAAHVPVEVVAATAAVESGFSMKSGPCIGIMQIHPATYRERYKRSGLNPNRLRDNIRLGSRELARHYRVASSRSGSERRRLAFMWGRYNGSGMHSAYVRKALKAYDAIKGSSGRN